MEVNRIVSPQPFFPQRRMAVDPIELRPIHHTVARDFSSLFTSPFPDGYRHSDVHHAIVFWLETRFLRPDKSGDDQYAVVTPQQGRFTGTYDPSQWSIESIHHSMVSMLDDQKYAAFHDKLLHHLWVQARAGKSPIAYEVASTLNESFSTLAPMIPGSVRMTFDLFFASLRTPETTRNPWLTKIMSMFIAKTIPEPLAPPQFSKRVEGAPQVNPLSNVSDDAFFTPTQVRSEQALVGILSTLIEDEIDLAQSQMPTPMKMGREIKLAQELAKQLSFLALSRYEDLTRKTIYQVILNYHTVERVLGAELVSELPLSLQPSQNHMLLFNTMRFSLIDLFLCYEWLYGELPLELLKYKLEVLEINPQKHVISWRFELTHGANTLKEYHVTYFTRLGLIVIRDQIKGHDYSLRFRFSTHHQVVGIVGKLVGKIVVSQSWGDAKTGQLRERMRIGRWYGRLVPTEKHHYEGQWHNRVTGETKPFSKHTQLTKNARGYFILSQVLMVGQHTAGGHHRYQDQLPLPLSVAGVLG